jgi:hypothetical protein
MYVLHPKMFTFVCFISLRVQIVFERAGKINAGHHAMHEREFQGCSRADKTVQLRTLEFMPLWGTAVTLCSSAGISAKGHLSFSDLASLLA